MPVGTRLTEATAYLNVLSYGPPGTGKTTGALTIANAALNGGRVLLIDAEAGAKTSALRRQGIDVDRIDVWPDNPSQLSFNAIEELYMEVRAAGGDEYVGVVVDSMTELHRRLLEGVVGAALAKAERLGKNRDRFAITLEDYGIVSSQMRTLLRRFRDLPSHLALTALERRDVDDDSSVTYGPALGPSVANDTMGLVDIVCYHSVETIGDQTFYTGITSPANRRKAKDRIGVLPGRMVDPTMARMLAYVEGDLVRSKDPRQLAARDAAKGTGAAAVQATEAEQQELDPEDKGQEN